MTVTDYTSVTGLAARLGISRQRVYTMVSDGLIKAAAINGVLAIPQAEADRVVEAAVRVETGKGRSRIVFDFI